MGDKNTFGVPCKRFWRLAGSLRCSASWEDGALKLTIQKFYQVAGGSTQLHGVASDIVPAQATFLNTARAREIVCLTTKCKGPIRKWSDSSHQLFVDELKRRSKPASRRTRNFVTMEDMDRLRRRLDDNHFR